MLTWLCLYITVTEVAEQLNAVVCRWSWFDYFIFSILNQMVICIVHIIWFDYFVSWHFVSNKHVFAWVMFSVDTVKCGHFETCSFRLFCFHQRKEGGSVILSLLRRLCKNLWTDFSEIYGGVGHCQKLNGISLWSIDPSHDTDLEIFKMRFFYLLL